ncbi:MAG TPA: hypothetical protein VJB57_04925 [Dehalococcoidia bacterium]|nr:hypothetical protein [Dehalococcoidia bacterium]
MYYPQAPKEPSGCMQAIIISRMIVGILAIPLGLIIGAILAVMLALYALSVHPLLGLSVVAAGILLLLAAVRWESRRVGRDIPRDD